MRLRRVAPPALDQRVVEHRFAFVLARDDDKLVPGAPVDVPASFGRRATCGAVGRFNLNNLFSRSTFAGGDGAAGTATDRVTSTFELPEAMSELEPKELDPLERRAGPARVPHLQAREGQEPEGHGTSRPGHRRAPS